MSYRTKPDIYGDVHSREIKPGQSIALIGAMLGMLAPTLGRTLANSGWFAERELVIWGAIAVGFLCLIGGSVAGVLAHRKARAEIEDMSHG